MSAVVSAGLAGPLNAAGHGLPAHPATVPYFTGSFAYRGHTYVYRMVGTNPKGNPVTTRVGVQIVPLRFVFSSGVALAAQSKVSAVLASPMFRPAHFRSGDTQYGDAMQRAEFWRYVHHRDWHVLLMPKALQQVTITVPAAEGWTARTLWGGIQGVIPNDDLFWQRTVLPKLIRKLHLDPHKLAVFLTRDVEVGAGALGMHSSTARGAKVWTWVTSTWTDKSTTCCVFQDRLESLSHEVVEWLNNPFATTSDNLVPAWRTAEIGCWNFLEVADPVFEHTLNVRGYSLTDATFLSWFAHQRPSIGIDGRYDYQGAFKATPQSCHLPAGAP